METLRSEQWEANEIITGLYLGSVVSASDKEGLSSHNITHIVHMECDYDPQFPDDFHYLVCRIEDNGSREILGAIDKAIPFIGEALEKGGSVLVHCAAGISRSPTLVMAYLWKNHREEFQWKDVYDCWNWLRGKRKRVYPHPGYLQILRELTGEVLLNMPLITMVLVG